MLGILFEIFHFIIAAKNKHDNAKYIGFFLFSGLFLLTVL